MYMDECRFEDIVYSPNKYQVTEGIKEYCSRKFGSQFPQQGNGLGHAELHCSEWRYLLCIQY